jgi:transcriptional regulator with XRE-family HTH domain
MNVNDASAGSDYPLAATEATQLLADALAKTQQQTGKTQRELSQELGYKSSVVLSHMASGRVPIPLDKTMSIAQVLNLDHSRFLLATLKQRFPDVPFESLLGIKLQPTSELERELVAIAGAGLDDLDDTTKAVMREVVAAARPESRWLSTSEIPVVASIRAFYPAVLRRGLTATEQKSLLTALSSLERNGGALSEAEQDRATNLRD